MCDVCTCACVSTCVCVWCVYVCDVCGVYMCLCGVCMGAYVWYVCTCACVWCVRVPVWCVSMCMCFVCHVVHVSSAPSGLPLGSSPETRDSLKAVFLGCFAEQPGPLIWHFLPKNLPCCDSSAPGSWGCVCREGSAGTGCGGRAARGPLCPPGEDLLMSPGPVRTRSGGPCQHVCARKGRRPNTHSIKFTILTT